MHVPKIRKIEQRDSFVGLRQAAPPPDRLHARVWHVWIEGGDPIGPVSADQVARGIRAGKVPSDASVRHETETFWGDLLDAPDIVAALKAVSAESAPPPPPASLIPPSMPPPSGMPASLSAKEFMVWVPGRDAVGPVSADQIARGIRAGKVPADASVQRVGDLFATDVLDEADVIAALKFL